MPRVQRIPVAADLPLAAPAYELRVTHRALTDVRYEVWQLPSPATPHIVAAVRIAGLKGRNFQLVEHRVLKRLAAAGIAPRRSDVRQGYALSEDLALNLGLLFRTLAPMRSRDNMRAVAQGIDSMGREEAAYWLGMAMHRKNPRRVLTALRVLLTTPKTRARAG